MNIYEKMLKATEKIETVAKNLKIEYGTTKYKAVSETDVLEAVKPIEIELGIYSYPINRKVITAEFVVDEKQKTSAFMRIETVYRFVNTEKPEEFIDIYTYGDGVDKQDKAPGKAMTYADKYALLKAYKIQTGEDPDKDPSKDMYMKSKYPETKQQKLMTLKLEKNLTNEKIAELILKYSGENKKANDLTDDEFLNVCIAIDEMKREIREVEV